MRRTFATSTNGNTCDSSIALVLLGVSQKKQDTQNDPFENFDGVQYVHVSGSVSGSNVYFTDYYLTFNV